MTVLAYASDALCKVHLQQVIVLRNVALDARHLLNGLLMD